ncbi:two-component system OmpR family response regulator [Arthrobacter pascens]|uniref:response regulator transcription factor n=1 Tax=Arthrobacter pascens TaxID=1677 RepID=UPI002782A423|nr:response regulator transcription factor [Arthrobacter pascens]MDQ0633174.1 two-component system OmpR family response regulator [Arthrobacter pascens]
MNDLGVAVVIEDDADMRNLLEGILLQSGFEVHTASDGRNGVDLVRDVRPTVVTLDVGLPDIDGFEVLRRIRGYSNAYVVMLTGRTEETDLLTALHGGADDYITKPFRPREMRARIAAMMRRERPQTPAGAPSAPQSEPLPPQEEGTESVLRHNGLALDCRTRTASVRGKALELTRSEFDLMQELLRGAGAVLTKAELVRAVRGRYYDQDALIGDSDVRAMEVHIANIRRKLGDDPDSPRWLLTVRGVGYRLAKPQ